MEQHYRGLVLAVRAGRGAEIEAELDAIDHGFAAAATHAPSIIGRTGLEELRREVQRLRLDVALAACTDATEGERLLGEIRRVLASRLPPEPALAAVVDGAADLDGPVPGISWALHFLFGRLRAGPQRLAARIGS